MDQIYRKCSRVRIWLGDAEADSDLVMELISSTTESCRAPIRDNPHKEITYSSTFARVAEQFYEDEKFAQHFRALLSLIIRAWFSRSGTFY
jgi:Heterokaryon incompatibility protein (HET)